MPLPQKDIAWPPAQLDIILPKLSEWSAWWAGDTDALRTAYQGATGAPRTRPSQHAGGIVGATARMFWGRPQADLRNPRHQLHVPIASDLCQGSADLLFAEQPQITTADEKDTTGQARLEDLLDDHAWQTLAEGAEVGAALGGVYHRITVDSDLSPAPFITTVHADAAWPEFRYGRLVAVTFWHVVGQNGQTVLRHLERHELDTQGDGVVMHALYQGTTGRLGSPIPLDEHPATAGIKVDAEQIATAFPRTPGLAAVYVPNQRPNRSWRTHPLGHNLGRSDIDGVEGLMDALDETYTSWMRDIRLGRARIFVAESALDDHGHGKGSSFDADREVFSTLNMLPSREASGMPIEAQQFKIRYEEHARTADELAARILQTAGYSAQTFGEGADGRAVTATEVRQKERRSFLTRDRKVRIYRPTLATLVGKLATVDRFINPVKGAPVGPLKVEFPDGVVESSLQLATTGQMLRAAEAASTKTLVQMVHPEWDSEQVDAEVALIQAETNRPVLDDPDMVGRAGQGLSDSFGADADQGA